LFFNVAMYYFIIVYLMYVSWKLDV